MPELKGRIALVTGPGARPLALELASRGATVVVTMNDALHLGNPRVHGLALDLASLASVRDAAREFIGRYRRLHLLVTDTTVPRLGPFLLAHLLLDTMKLSGRVVVLTDGHGQQIWSTWRPAALLTPSARRTAAG